MIWIAAMAVLLPQAEPFEGELSEHLRTPVKATMTSTKRAAPLLPSVNAAYTFGERSGISSASSAKNLSSLR